MTSDSVLKVTTFSAPPKAVVRSARSDGSPAPKGRPDAG